jgi:predicted ATP-grasp superfamily ATP-dependent carboligase
MSNVFVTDSQVRSSLAVIRSLGRKGLNVIAGEETRFATGGFSKYCAGRVVYPSPTREKNQFVKFLLKKVQKKEYEVLFPVADPCLMPIIDNEEELSRYTTIALPPRNIFMRGHDKGQTLKFAIANNIPCPKTYFIENLEEIYHLEDKLDFPSVIKPRIGSGKRGVKICESFQEVVDGYKSINRQYGKIILQEFIPNGGEFGVYTLLNSNSELRALSVQRRVRSYPVSGGPSTFRETFKNSISEKAVEYSIILLKAMNWVGLAMVEFRIDARNGIPKLMEINPRFWGSLQLSILGGVDFPYLLYKMIIDGDIEPVLNYEKGVGCRWLLPGDILWFLSAPNKLKNLPTFLDTSVPDDIISFEDFGPTLGFTLATLRYLFDRDMWKFVLRR